MPRIPETRVIDGTSLDILNAIREDASPMYQDRVPIAQRTNIALTGAAILDIPATTNEFLDALVNRISMVYISNKDYQNPLKEFKQGMLELGESIEEIFVDILKAHNYDPELAETELYKREKPSVNTIFHIVNYKTFYKTTIERQQLELAFVSINGVTDLISKIVANMYTSLELDEYLNMKNLVYQYGSYGMFYPVGITAVTDSATANQAVEDIKTYIELVGFMSRTYNAMGVMTRSLPEDLILLVDARFKAKMDVQVLARAFNMDKVEFLSRVVTVDDFGGLTGVRAVLCDKGWFKVFDKMRYMDDQKNAQGLYWNYFLHTWQIFSVSPFHTAIVFVEATPAITSVTVSPATATLDPGQQLQLSAAVVVTGWAPTAVDWSVASGAPAGTTLATINSKGVLTVPAADDNVTLVVTATSAFDETKTGTATITLNQPEPPGG